MPPSFLTTATQWTGGPVVFDIGGDIGALIMYVEGELEVTEVPLEWDRDPCKDVHTGARRQRGRHRRRERR